MTLKVLSLLIQHSRHFHLHLMNLLKISIVIMLNSRYSFFQCINRVLLQFSCLHMLMCSKLVLLYYLVRLMISACSYMDLLGLLHLTHL